MAIKLYQLLTNRISLGAATTSFLLHPIKVIFLICKRTGGGWVSRESLQTFNNKVCTPGKLFHFNCCCIFSNLSLQSGLSGCKCFRIYTMKHRMLISIVISLDTRGKLVWVGVLFSQILSIKLPYGCIMPILTIFSVTLWQSVLLMEEDWILGEKDWSNTNH